MIDPAVLTGITRLATPGEVYDLISGQARGLGYQVWAIGAPSRGERFAGYFYSTWPAWWLRLYRRENLLRHDPLPEAAARNAMPFLWSELIAGQAGMVLGEGHLRAFALGARHGFREGLVVPIHGPGRYFVLASFAGRSPDTSAAARSALHLLALHANVRLHTLHGQPLGGGARDAALLTGRERAALDCVRLGLSDTGAAARMGCGARTVRFHLDNARRKLGARTRGQALAAALAMGLLPETPVDSDSSGT